MTPRRSLGALVVCAGLLLSLFVNYHSYLADFNFVPGDRGDTRLVVFTLEHWVKVLRGQEGFYALQMFYPDPHALGYADGLFLFAIPYAAFRASGLDPFTSYQLFFVFMTALGYAAWLTLLRRALRLSLSFAVLGAVLLTSLNSLQLQAQIGKLTGFHLFPVLIGLLVYFLRAGDKRSWRAVLALWAFSALLSLFLFTSYYPAWFFLYTLGLFVGMQLGALAIDKGLAAAIRRATRFVAGNSGALLGALVVFGLALVPFMITYAPIIASNQQRSYGLALEFSPTIKDIVNVSPKNLMWSHALDDLGFDFGGLEVQMGSPPIVLALFLVAAAFLAMRLIRAGPGGSDPRDRYMIVLTTTALAIFVLIVKFQDVSAWYVIHALVPGASALRAVGRYLIVVDMIVILTAVYGLNEWFSGVASRTVKAKPCPPVALGIVAALLIAEQANGATFHLDKAGQIAIIQRYEFPGQACEAFFTTNAASSDLPFGYYQLDAMMVSMNLGIPTVNGYSGFEPDRAFTLATTSIEYKYRILDWLTRRGAVEGICELDLQTRIWRPTDVTAEHEEYEDLYLASILANFRQLYESASAFLADGNDISNLTPQILEENGYLDPSFGYGAGLRYRWIRDRYWIGETPCGNFSCVGIRVVGKPIEVHRILEAYASRAHRVLYPEPSEWYEGLALPEDAESQLLMLFRFDLPQS